MSDPNHPPTKEAPDDEAPPPGRGQLLLIGVLLAAVGLLAGLFLGRCSQDTASTEAAGDEAADSQEPATTLATTTTLTPTLGTTSTSSTMRPTSYSCSARTPPSLARVQWGQMRQGHPRYASRTHTYTHTLLFTHIHTLIYTLTRTQTHIYTCVRPLSYSSKKCMD